MKKKAKPQIKIKIQTDDFNVSEETKILHNYQTGAIVNFVGVVEALMKKQMKQLTQ